MQNDRKTEVNEKGTAFIKGVIARKKYKLPPQAKEVSYMAFVLSNESLINHYGAKREGRSVLVGTSCLRSVLIACELSTPEHLTKLIIIDNSKQVHAFWNAIRKIAWKQSDVSDEIVAGQKFFDEFTKEIKRLKRQIVEDYKEILMHFYYLFQKYGSQSVRKIIANTVLIKQDWQDTKTFKKLNNIFEKLEIENVYVYCSNIVGYMHRFDKSGIVTDLILQNIELLNPKHSIHADLPDDITPMSTYVCDDSTPARVREKIFSLKPVKYNIQPIQLILIIFAASDFFRTESLLLAMMLYVFNKIFAPLGRDPATVNWPGRVVSEATFFATKSPLITNKKDLPEKKDHKKNLGLGRTQST